jgi:hypothetical protein
MGVPPLRIDILTTFAGVEFRECHPRRRTIAVDDTEIPFIGLEDLIKNKRATGRAQDLAQNLADLEHLP